MKNYFNSAIIGLLSILPFNTYAQDNLAMSEKRQEIENSEGLQKKIIKPTLEEITNLLSQHHSKILERNNKIKKLGYINESSPEELYKFLKENFQNKILLAYVNGDDQTQNKNIWCKDSTFDERLSAGGAIGFLYATINLHSNLDIGFLFIELKNFTGNWNEVGKLFNTKDLGFPFIAEFKMGNSGNYIFIELACCSTDQPEHIYKNIDLLVNEYSQK